MFDYQFYAIPIMFGLLALMFILFINVSAKLKRMTEKYDLIIKAYINIKSIYERDAK